MIGSLVGYAVVVSQPLAYLVVMTRAQRALSAAAFIELRQQINPVMTRRLPAIYLATLVAVLALLVLALRGPGWIMPVAAAVALLCLAGDIALMLRENVPINGVMDRWSTADYPDDWADYRAKWFAVFRIRQVVLLAGYLALAAGVVFG